MHIKLALVAISTLALAACGGSGEVEDPSDPDQIAAATADLPQPQPGEYRTSGELVEFELAGVSDEEAQFARNMFETMMTQEQTMCMTQEDVEAGYQEFLRNLNQGAEGCEFETFTVEGNTIDASMQCDDDAGSTGTMAFNGTVDETSQDMTISMDMVAQEQSIKMTLRTQLERVGDCAS